MQLGEARGLLRGRGETGGGVAELTDTVLCACVFIDPDFCIIHNFRCTSLKNQIFKSFFPSKKLKPSQS